MARHARADVVERLRKWMEVKASPGIDTVAPEILPVLLVGDLTVTEKGGLTRLAIGSREGPATAGVVNNNQLWNPANSGVELFLDRVVVSSSSAQVLRLLYRQTALTSLVNTRKYKDELKYVQTSPRLPAGEVRYQNNATSLGDIVASSYVAVGVPIILSDLDIRIQEEQGVVVSHNTVNTTCMTTFEWREVAPV